MRTLAVLVGRRGVALPLDPPDGQRYASHGCPSPKLHELFLPPAIPTSSTGEARKTKKARLYESDSMFAAPTSSKDQLHTLSVEELASTQAALEILIAVYPELTTTSARCTTTRCISQCSPCWRSLRCSPTRSTPIPPSYAARVRARGHRQASTCWSRRWRRWARCVWIAPRVRLALVLPRAIPVLERIAHAPDGGDVKVRGAAERALVDVHASRKGKFVPIARVLGLALVQGTIWKPLLKAPNSPAPRMSAMPSPPARRLVRRSSVSPLLCLALLDQRLSMKTLRKKARMDIDAITAESAELFHATGTTADTPLHPLPHQAVWV